MKEFKIDYKSNDCEKCLAYTYMITFEINKVNKYYYGVRYANIKNRVSVRNDFFKIYFTSSKIIKELLLNGIIPTSLIVHKTFKNYKDACVFEVNFLKKLNAKARKDFINQVNHWDNSLPSNSGRIKSKEVKQKIGIASRINQSSREYRQIKSKLMLNKYNTAEYKDYMQIKNDVFWKSEKGKQFAKIRGEKRRGEKHSLETKKKMSETANRNKILINFKQRALLRKRYTCPLCNMPKLDGGNFSKHMAISHDWSKFQNKKFKDERK